MQMFSYTMAQYAVRRIPYDQPPPRRNGGLGVFCCSATDLGLSLAGHFQFSVYHFSPRRAKNDTQ